MRVPVSGYDDEVYVVEGQLCFEGVAVNCGFGGVEDGAEEGFLGVEDFGYGFEVHFEGEGL